jgi:predicted RNA-binding protein with RPS1 domain
VTSLFFENYFNLGGSVKQSNWRSSGKPQEKPKQSHARRRQKKKQFKNLANKLRKDPARDGGVFRVWLL